MASIIDYVLLNANKDFETLPFSKVDGLILSQLSYLRFDGVVPLVDDDDENGVFLSDLAECEDYEAVFPLPRTAEKNKKLLNAVAYSKRFGSIRLRFYSNIFSSENDTQFSAITFIINPQLAFIAFRGTDSTITGWKENCNMLISPPVASQKLSAPYVEKVAEKIDSNLILAGHSKGGNLAIYSAVMCRDDIKDRIIEIQSFDNPGFSEKFINSPAYMETVGKIVKTVPEESMVGMLLNNRGSYRVIKSDGEGFYQHDPFMWQIDGNDFVDGDEVVAKAKVTYGAFNEWVMSTKPEQREQFIDTFFRLVEETNTGNAATFGKWSENLRENLSDTLNTLKDIDPETRKIMITSILQMLGSAKESVKKVSENGAQKRITNIKAKIKQIPLIAVNELNGNDNNKK